MATANKSELRTYFESNPMHAHGSMDWATLSFLFDQLAERAPRVTVETGCGASTIAFALNSEKHIAYCLDDRENARSGESSVEYALASGLFPKERVEFVFGPTQLTLPMAQIPSNIDAVFIDGPHGFPFPELEYFYFYPKLNHGGLLIIDDLKIPTIRRLFEFLREDAMFEELAIISDNTGFLRRTDAPVFHPHGDSWWEQHFNRRRLPSGHPHALR